MVNFRAIVGCYEESMKESVLVTLDTRNIASNTYPHPLDLFTAKIFLQNAAFLLYLGRINQLCPGLIFDGKFFAV